jgi:DNA mismatch repair ATPase MutL
MENLSNFSLFHYFLLIFFTQVSTLLELTADQEGQKDEVKIDQEILLEFDVSQNIEDKKNKFNFEGFLSKPNQGRSCGDRQYLFINSRPCDNPKVVENKRPIRHFYTNLKDFVHFF